MRLLLVALLPPLLLASCASTGRRADSAVRPRCVEGRTGREVDLAQVANELARCDVVFLGEEHGNGAGNRQQQLLLELLVAERPDVALSMEMFERDVQPSLDAYLAGEIDEPAFLRVARPWPNYRESYRPAVELARARGLGVLAANVPQSLASEVAEVGLDAAAGQRHAARSVRVVAGPYRERFDAALGDSHAETGALDNVFAAQCLRDDTMAESIASRLVRGYPAPPLIVHWGGRFHSDYGMGVVARLVERRPDIKIGIVTMLATADPAFEPSAAERRAADFLMIVPAT